MLIDQLAEINREAVDIFFRTQGNQRCDQWPLMFHEDARIEYSLPVSGQLVVEGNDKAEKWIKENVIRFPEWNIVRHKTFYSSDPNKFLVKVTVDTHMSECDGSVAARRFWYVMEFLMNCGKIKRLRLTMDPCEKMYDEQGD